MYKAIAVPVDLEHTEKLTKALATAADLSKVYSIPVHYVAVTAATPGRVAHNPQEFAQKLQAFAEEQGAKFGVRVNSKAVTSHDPAVDVDKAIQRAVKEIGADLVVMASHIPGVVEHLISSNAGYFASHSDASVFVVR